MRGIIRTARRTVELVEMPYPELEPGTAIVRVRASGICGSDLHGYRDSEKREEKPSGHEVAGEVVDLMPHDGVNPHVKAGDLVALDTICLGRACGDCRWCAEGAFVHCERKRGRGWSGAFAEYIVRDLRGLFPLKKGMSAAEGALVEPLAVAVHALRLAGLREGDTVAVIGAGTIGLNCVAAATALGAVKVFATARYAHQAEAARALGAEALAGTPEEAEEAVKAGTGGRGADLVIETVGGRAPTLNQAWGLVRRKGRVAVLGLFSEPMPVDLAKPLSKEVTVYFPDCYGEIDGRHDYDVAIDLIASGKAPVKRLLTHAYSFDFAQEAFDTALDKSSRSIKVQFAL